MNIEKLRELASEYMSSCDAYFSHLRADKTVRSDGNYSSWQFWYGMYEREMRTYLHSLTIACDMIDADVEKLLSVEKAIRRHEKKTDWGWPPDIYRLPKHEESYAKAIKKYEKHETDRLRWLP